MKKFGAVAVFATSIAVLAVMLMPSANAQVTVTPVCPPGTTNAAYCTYYYVTPTPTASPTATPQPGKQRPRSLTLTAKPKRDARKPFRFSVNGKLNRPSGVGKRRGCRGTVTVRFKQGRKTAKAKTIAIKRSNCKYSAKRIVVKGGRLKPKRRGVLKVRARFNGNSVLRKRNARAVRIVRYGPKR